MKFGLAFITAMLTTSLTTVSALPSSIAEVDLSIAPVSISPVTIDTESALEKRSTAVNRAAILFPAYIYPSSGSPAAWQPLYTAISSYPHVSFHVIINPNSGPGSATPNSDYATAIKTLRKYSNVVLLGYVHTSWGARSSDAVYADIQTYAGWKSQGYSMDGIFFDEAPTSASTTLYTYMANVTCLARQSIVSTLKGNKAMIYFNPGAVPETRYYALADFIAIFEDTYATYLSDASTFAPGTSLPMSMSAFFVHSMSSNWTQSQMTSFVNGLTNGDALGSVFLTSNTNAADPYAAFGADWTTFVAAVASVDG